MKIKLGFKTWDTRDWVLGEELGDRCLRCPDCGCGIILRFYDMACGTMALNFCPYCGKKRKEAKAIGTEMRTKEGFAR